MGNTSSPYITDIKPHLGEWKLASVIQIFVKITKLHKPHTYIYICVDNINLTLLILKKLGSKALHIVAPKEGWGYYDKNVGIAILICDSMPFQK